jgi:hypothetical protein
MYENQKRDDSGRAGNGQDQSENGSDHVGRRRVAALLWAGDDARYEIRKLDIK